MVDFKRLDDYTFQLTADGNLPQIYPCLFTAYPSVKPEHVQLLNREIGYEVDFSIDKVTVDGTPFSNVPDLVQALNPVVKNFKTGGGTPLPTSTTDTDTIGFMGDGTPTLPLSALVKAGSIGEPQLTAELNARLNTLESMTSIKGSVDTYADLLTLDITKYQDNDGVVVEKDETHSGKSSLYVVSAGIWVYGGEFTVDLSNYYTKSTIDTKLGEKVDKVPGKDLSTEDFTTARKDKLDSIADGAEVNVQSDWNQTNATADDFIKNKPEPTPSFVLDYSFSTATSEPLTGSKAQFDTSIQNAATKFRMTYNTANGVDSTIIFSMVAAGSRIRVQDKDDHTKYKLLKATGAAIDKTTYAEIPVEFVSGGVDLTNQRVLVAITGGIVPANTMTQVFHDNTLLGTGNSTTNQLKVDTTVIATQTAIASLQTEIDGVEADVASKLALLQGAFVYRGTIALATTAVTPAALTTRLQSLLSRVPQLGDVLTDTDSYDWYYDGATWQGMGQTNIVPASGTTLGLMKAGGDLGITGGVATVAAGVITQAKIAVGVTLPANGGNADTVDSKHATDFAPSGFGLGTTTPLLITNADDFRVGGWAMGYNAANAPEPGDGLYFNHLGANTYFIQRCVILDSQHWYERRCYNNVWGAWSSIGMRRIVVGNWNSISLCQVGDILIGSNVSANSPTGTYFTAQVLSSDDNASYMKLIGIDYNGYTYTRSRVAGSWGDWRRLVTYESNGDIIAFKS